MTRPEVIQRHAEELEKRLRNTASDYELVERASDENVRIRFVGMFNSVPTTWDATIRTLSDYQKSMRSGLKHRQFLEIVAGDVDYKLMIGLNLHVIDEAAIKKSIIMVRKYKRLHTGRHEYGDFVDFRD